MIARPNIGNRRILVIDDSDNIHADFRHILAPPVDANAALAAAEAALFGQSTTPVRAGFAIDSAYQGEQALALVCAACEAEQPYAMAFVDMRMPPGWDGVETIARLWERDPKLQIAVCTAYSDHCWESMAQRLPLDDRLLILKKPFDTIEIYQMACALTAKWWMEHEWDQKVNRLEHAVEERTRDLQKAYEALREQVLERRHLEGQLLLTQKLEAIGQLAAGIAHEINTPVQYIGDSVLFLQTAFAELEQLRQAYRSALDLACNGAQRDDIQTALAAAEEQADLAFNVREVPRAFERTMEGVERVTKIVRAMKEFSYQSSEEFSGADINQALESTLEVARGEYKYIAVVESSFQPLPLVTCDISALKQVFLNLIINAAHAIRESGQDVATGKIRIHTSVAGEWVTISVEDNGCGIPDAIASRVYDPFFTTKEVGRGTGQGLAIAHRIVATKHSGRIEFHTQVGVGTRFLIHLPVAGAAATTVASLRAAS